MYIVYIGNSFMSGFLRNFANYIQTYTTYWRLPLVKVQYIRRSRSMWHSATHFLNMVRESVNKDLDIHVAKGLGFT